MNFSTKTIYIFVIITGLLLIVGIGVYYSKQPSIPGKFDTFAQCLQEKGAVFYGAFWCPHCQNQKAMFGKSVKFLPYVECSTPDGQSQLEVCNEKEIKSYPTWIFADESRLDGEIPLEKLAEKTGCVLPQ
ncbi:MAG: thioredoxin domain-containing protein [bacterium]|nr:thioredoxin domain-containing protein [bacterium]